MKNFSSAIQPLLLITMPGKTTLLSILSMYAKMSDIPLLDILLYYDLHWTIINLHQTLKTSNM